MPHAASQQTQARRHRACELRLTGVGYAGIAQAPGYAGPSGPFRAVRAAIADGEAESAVLLRAVELARLDALQLALWSRATRGNLRSIDGVLAIMKGRARLLGLDGMT